MITIFIGEQATGKTTKALQAVGTRKHLWISRPLTSVKQLCVIGVEVVVFDGMLWNQFSINVIQEFLSREKIPDVIFVFQTVHEMKRVLQ